MVHGFTICDGRPGGSGAGILISGGASPVISGCILTSNNAEYPYSGGAVSATGGLIRDCIISNNRADAGGGLALSGNAAVYNCLIIGNYADEMGGGLACGSDGMPTVSHCTITENMSGEGGGGVFLGNLVLTNSIIWDNWAAVDGSDGYVWGWSYQHTFSYSYSELGQFWYIEDYAVLDPGPGNITADPLFATGPLGPGI